MGAGAKWKGAVAWSYLLAAMILLPLLVAASLEQVGALDSSTLADELPAVHVTLLFDALAVGGLIFLYWPIAAIVVLVYWNRDRRFAVPAILFLVADGLLTVNWIVLDWPDFGPLFAVCLILGWVFVVAAIRTWILWARQKT